MECNNYAKNGLSTSEIFVRGRQVAHEFDVGGARALRLGFAAGLPGTPAVGARHHAVGPGHPLRHHFQTASSVRPFMSNMDEISYWIYTKRAPCLLNYNNPIKRQNEAAHCSKPTPKSVPSITEVPSTKKKKKRKLSLLEDDSVSTKKQENVFFDTSQSKKQTVVSSCKSDTFRSDIDFNIKNSSVLSKPKQSKLEKSNRPTLHKKNKLVTSTPKVSQLRRSVRQAQQTLNNISQLNSSVEVPNNTNIINNDNAKYKKSTELLAGGDQSTDNIKIASTDKFTKSKNDKLNGQFEDLSDVSGLTANYIRSTKLYSAKTPRKLRCKNSRTLVKQSQTIVQKDSSNMVVCMNKSVNTTPKCAGNNCSTDSVNVLNLVTTKSTEKSTKVCKSTSLLKFMDLRTGKVSASNKIGSSRTRAKGKMNVSFQSSTSMPRYPKRYKNHSTIQREWRRSPGSELPSEENIEVDKRQKNRKNPSEFNNSDRKENPEATTVSRTRSGRGIGLTLRHPENSVLVLSNSTEQVSSLVSMNVASPTGELTERKKKRVTRQLRSKKLNDKHGSLQKDSLRGKSGFTACFSDSDDDSEPLKQKKYFCA